MIIPNYFHTFAENIAMQPKVSIIITVYNREKYIEECARSLFEQSLDDIEYIFVNDASTDNSIEIIKTTANDYPRRVPLVKIITLDKNGGVANARNIGIENATGEYIIHTDSDDWVDRDMYEQLYKKALETDADIVGCNICHEYPDGTSYLIQHYKETTNENIRSLIRGDIHPSLCTSLTRTSLIKDNHLHFPSGHNMGEDLYFNLSVYLHAKKITNIDFAPYHYRHTPDSSSFNHTRKTIDSGIAISVKIEELMKDTGRYEEFANDIDYRKFRMKLSLVKDFDNKENYFYWLKTFPETHTHIWSYKEIDWKLRLELWFAAHKMYGISQLIKKALDWQNQLKHL